MSSSEMNPLLSPFDGRFGEIPFDRIRTEHFKPALERGIELSRQRLEKLKANPTEPDFENTLVALETMSEPADLVAEVFFNMLSAEADEALHALAKDLSPMVAAFGNDVSLDATLFARVKKLHDKAAFGGSKDWTSEQKRLLEKTYKGFVRNGALLDGESKTRLREIDAELARLTPLFSENVLKASNAFELVIDDPSRLRGLPDSAREAAAAEAKERGKPPGHWVFTLQAPSFLPIVTYAEDRALREEVSRAYQSRAFGGEFDNRAALGSIVKLRNERARLLGYSDHSAYVLEERMARDAFTVNEFLEKMLAAAKPAAERDLAEVKKFAAENGGPRFDFSAWDFAFWSEKLKESKYRFSDEELRPYFKLDNVITGAFSHAEKLFGLEFKRIEGIPIYHADVQVYEVTDRAKGTLVGLFYADFFPRETKKSGAWMTPLREQGLFNGEIRRPHVSIVCNFTKPTPSKPSLLTLDEVRTLYHEFGHALHGLLSECSYRSIAGTNVYWDFVELPSQLMENWVLEPEVLEHFALHYETGKPMPRELAKKIKDSSNYLAGYRTLRQLNFALLDMAWHGGRASGDEDVGDFEARVTERTRILPAIPGTNTSCAFSHIFSGGYSAGYYSYKWAEVLEADAFEAFKETSLYDLAVAGRLRSEILSRGGTEHPMELYKRFRGREPDPNALLRRDGLL